jgi:hypothetical protein
VNVPVGFSKRTPLSTYFPRNGWLAGLVMEGTKEALNAWGTATAYRDGRRRIIGSLAMSSAHNSNTTPTTPKRKSRAYFAGSWLNRAK